MGRLRANFARLGNPMQDCHLRKEPNVTGFPFPPPTVILSDSEGSQYVQLMRQMLLNTSRREGCRLAVRNA